MSSSPLYGLALALVALLCATVGWMVWRQHVRQGAQRPFVLLMAAITWWALTYAFYWWHVPGPTPSFWLDMTYGGVVLTAPSFFVFVLRLTRHDAWWRPWMAWAMGLMALITLVLLWTDPAHGLFFGKARNLTTGAIFTGGPWFWVHTVYSYALILGSLGLLVVTYAQAPTLLRRQIGILLAGLLIPLAVNGASLLGWLPLRDLDLTPFVFAFTGVAYLLGVARLGLLDLAPIARNQVVDIMNQGVLVLDQSNRIVDINPAARRLLGLGPQEPVLGKPVEPLLRRWPHLIARYRNLHQVHEDIFLAGPPDRWLEVTITPLLGHDGTAQGRLVLFNDITQRKQTEAALLQAHRRLEDRLGEMQDTEAHWREEAMRDALTGVYNRRYLQQAFTRYLSQSRAQGKPLTILLLDIDHFKQVNDQQGHLVGDLVLRALAQTLQAHVRGRDVVARYGGEEFLILMEGVALPEAAQRAEELRRQVGDLALLLPDGSTLRITVSIGVAAYPEHGEEMGVLLHAADMALYQAKAGGRNRVVVAHKE